MYTLSLTSIDVTSQGEADHGSLQQQLNISANLTRQCVTIDITNDNETEENEFFQISISSITTVSSSTRIYQLHTQSATVTIIDDDLMCSPTCVNGVCIHPGVCLCDEGWIDEDCSQETCQPPCVYGTCDVSTGYCDCDPGYTGLSCNVDLRGCDVDNGGCEQICTDFLGGYNCSCMDGFHPQNDESSCEDIDECMGDHGCDQTCVNTPGSYYCNCERGFQLINNTECDDIDECSILSLCDQLCVNTIGSFQCDCAEGYQLFATFFCQDINECRSPDDNNCNISEPAPAECVNVEGGYECVCDQHIGYTLSSGGTACEDVNECNDMNGGCQHSCTNTFGSYICSCDPGYLHLEDNSTSIGKCLPLPLLLECVISNSSAHVTIDCTTNRPPQNILCSFNNGLQHRCSYPVTINRDVSPLGNHSLTISVEDDEGFQTETTVHYFLEEDTKPTVPAVVPPLLVSFINDSPRVMRDSVEADILLSRPVQSLVCRLKRDRVEVDEVDCSSGHAVFSSLVPGVYTLRVVATNRHPDKEFIKCRFEVTTDAERCTLHLINDGVTVTGESATVEFTGRGPVKGYHCQLDKMEFYEYSSPVRLNGLSTGKHILKVVPSECGQNKMNLKTELIIA